MKKQTKLAFGTGILIGLLFIGIGIAVPPATKYNPGDVTDPGCGPTDTNCSIEISGGANASNGLSIDGTSGDVELGGDLTRNTEIVLDNDGNETLTFTSDAGDDFVRTSILNSYDSPISLPFNGGGTNFLGGLKFDNLDEGIEAHLGADDVAGFSFSSNSQISIVSPEGIRIEDEDISISLANDKIAFVSENINNSTASVGQVLTLKNDSNGEVEYSDFPGYSTTEQLLHEKWIDGKDVYRKVINVPVPGTSTGYIDLSSDVVGLDTLIEAKAIVDASSDDGRKFVSPASDGLVFAFDFDTSYLGFYVNDYSAIQQDFSIFDSLIVIIEYTKI